MAHRDFILEYQRPLVLHHVQNAAVLDIGALPDADVVHVASHHALRPNARIFPNRDVTDNDRRRIDIGRIRNLRPLSLIPSNVWFSAQELDSLRK